MDDLRQLLAHLLHFEHAAADFFGELVHAHHARRHRRLDFTHHLLDVVGGHGGLICQAADFHGHDGESQTVFPGLLGLDGGIEGEQIGLVGDFGDGGDDGFSLGVTAWTSRVWAISLAKVAITSAVCFPSSYKILINLNVSNESLGKDITRSIFFPPKKVGNSSFHRLNVFP